MPDSPSRPATPPSSPPRPGRRGILAAGLALAAGALTGCGDSKSAQHPPTTESGATGVTRKPSGDIVMALVTLADQSTDPHVTRAANLAPITTSCFEQFSRWDEHGILVPALASRMEETPDHLQLTFTLRDDATFWDGTPVTASDAAWSFQRYISLERGDTYQQTLRDQVDSVTALDAKTVVVTMKAPSTLRLSFGIINPRGWNIASRAHHERVGEDAFRALPMCSGPFRLAKSQAGEFTTIEAYEGHYERAPAVQSLRMDIVADQATRIARLRTGEADFIDGVAGPARSQVQDDPAITLYESPAAALATMYFQEPGAWPYNDIRVRQALQLATNQEALSTALLNGAASRSPAAHIFPVTRGYDAAMFAPQPFDPAKAKALLAQAGTGGDVRVHLSGYDSSSAPQIPNLLQAVAGMWRDVGVQVDVDIIEAGAYLQRYSAHQLGGITVLASGAWFDGESLLRTDYLNGELYSPPTPPRMSDAIRALGQQFGETQRVTGIQEVYRQIIDGAWSVTLPWTNAVWAARKSTVRSWRPYAGWAYPHALETLEHV